MTISIFASTAKLVGFEGYTPSDATASGQDILKGMNYASGVADIIEATGYVLVRKKYLLNFINTSFINIHYPFDCV